MDNNEEIHINETRPAVKSDFPGMDMPEENETVMLDHKFTDEQMEILRQGFIPKSMDSKWFWYMDRDILYAYRSWTGYCIYIIEFSGNTLRKVTINRNPKQHKCKDDIETEKRHLIELLEVWCYTRK